MYNTLVVEKKDRVATVTFNRPDKLNCLNLQMHDEFLQVLDELACAKEVFVVILTAAGRAFCTGHDVETVREGSAKFRKHMICRRLVDFEKPLIAAVNGYALAEGFQIALAADIIIATYDTKFGGLGAALGSICNYAVFALPRVIGRNRAAEMLYTARQVSGQEAFEWGLANRVVPNEQLMQTALEMAETIAMRAPMSVRYSRQGLRMGEYDVESEKWASEVIDILSCTEDQKEACTAIIEKRKPVFKGK